MAHLKVRLVICYNNLKFLLKTRCWFTIPLNKIHVYNRGYRSAGSRKKTQIDISNVGKIAGVFFVKVKPMQNIGSPRLVWNLKQLRCILSTSHSTCLVSLSNNSYQTDLLNIYVVIYVSHGSSPKIQEPGEYTQYIEMDTQLQTTYLTLK